MAIIYPSSTCALHIIAKISVNCTFLFSLYVHTYTHVNVICAMYMRMYKTVYAGLSSGGRCLKCLNTVTEYEYDPLPTTFMCTYIHHMHTCIFSMDLIESTFLNTDPANSGDPSTGGSSVRDSISSSQPPARTTTAEMSPKATPSPHPPASTTTAEMSPNTTPSSQPPASTTTAEMSPKATPSSQPPARTTTAEMSSKATPPSRPSSSTTVLSPEEVGSGPLGTAIGGAVGAVVVLAVIGVVFLIVGVVCVVRRKKYTVSKPVLYDMPPDAYCTFGE